MKKEKTPNLDDSISRLTALTKDDGGFSLTFTGGATERWIVISTRLISHAETALKAVHDAITALEKERLA